MRFRLLGVEICISFWFLGSLAIILSIDIMGLFYIFFLSILAHEASHLVIFRLFGLKVNRINLTAFGITIIPKQNVFISYKKEILCYLAGPMANFIIALLVHNFGSPIFQTRAWVAINLVIGLFNLVPILPLDGGRILQTFLLMFLSHKTTNIISNVLAVIFLSPLYLFSILIYIKQRNHTAIVSCILLTTALLTGKDC